MSRAALRRPSTASSRRSRRSLPSLLFKCGISASDLLGGLGRAGRTEHAAPGQFPEPAAQPVQAPRRVSP